MRRFALLLGAALAATVLQVAVAAPAQAGETTCTLWRDVPFKDVNTGWSNDRHMRVQGQTQKCRRDFGPWVTFARAHLTHVSADTWPQKDPARPFDNLTVRLYHDNGCQGCETLWDSGPLPEPGIGKDYYSGTISMTAGQTYGVLLTINYKNPPNPGWFQTGHQDWTA
jgi:hypothetical protein